MKIVKAVKVWMAYKKAEKLIKETKMEEGKSKWKSKTLWFNALTGIVLVVDKVAGADLFTNPQIQSGLALFLTIGNGVLRFMTTEPLKK